MSSLALALGLAFALGLGLGLKLNANLALALGHYKNERAVKPTPFLNPLLGSGTKKKVRSLLSSKMWEKQKIWMLLFNFD